MGESDITGRPVRPDVPGPRTDGLRPDVPGPAPMRSGLMSLVLP
ncbi:hypothetical protein ACFWOJ_26530 [Streptomyces sp. NPDC058439]